MQSITNVFILFLGDKLYDCQFCKQEFRSKANMYAHIKRNHTEEWEKGKIERSKGPGAYLLQAENDVNLSQ